MSKYFVPVPVRVLTAIRQRQLLQSGQRLLVALSGGQDSWCLLHLLRMWQAQWEWQLFVVHCNHRWTEDETRCAEFLTDYFHRSNLVGVVDTMPTVYLDEQRARQWRYETYQHWAAHWHCDAVLTGHTGTDRAETILFNLVRGTGAAGLTSLSWTRPLQTDQPGSPQLVRPLLSVWRQETAAICASEHLPVWPDLTNQDRTHARNRLRLDVIPYLKTHLNPQVEAALVRYAMIMADEHDWVTTSAAHLWPLIYDPPSRIQRLRLREMHPALQRHLLSQFLRQELATTPEFEQVEWLRQLLWAPRRTRTPPFPGGRWAEVREKWITIFP